MARGTTLTNLLTMLKGELGVDSDTTVAPGGDDVLTASLTNKQRWLAGEYDWPFLEIREEMNMTAGTRYYTFPTTFNMEREIRAECYWSNLWYSIEDGIKLINYNTLNPELNQRLDPVIRWQPYNGSGTVTQFEVWPLPATATRVRLTGQRVLNALSVSVPADLDDTLIVLFAAAELAMRYQSADAQSLGARAQVRLQRLRAGIPAPSQVFSMRGERAGSRSHREAMRPMVGVNYTP